MKTALIKISVTSLALLCADAAVQVTTGQSLLASEAHAQANHNTTRSNRKQGGIAAPDGSKGDVDIVSDSPDCKSAKGEVGGRAFLQNPARCDKTGQAADANTYGSTRSNKESIAAPSDANTNTSRSNKKNQGKAPEIEMRGHVTLVRVGAPSGGGSWCEPYDCATFEDAQKFYSANPTLDLPKFIRRKNKLYMKNYMKSDTAKL